MAKDAAYFESSGFGSANDVEKGRVKYAYRERDAFSRSVRGAQSAIAPENQEGLAAYVRSEEAIQNLYGKEGKKAQKIIAGFEKFYNLSQAPTRSQMPKKTIKLVWGSADPSKGEIDISQALTDFNWENGSVKKDEYEQSAMGLVRDFQKYHLGYNNAPITLDLAGLRKITPNFSGDNEFSLLTDVKPLITDDENYIPSLTDKVLNQIVRAA
jgi:hypothetical protein